MEGMPIEHHAFFQGVAVYCFTSWAIVFLWTITSAQRPEFSGNFTQKGNKNKSFRSNNVRLKQNFQEYNRQKCTTFFWYFLIYPCLFRHPGDYLTRQSRIWFTWRGTKKNRFISSFAKIKKNEQKKKPIHSPLLKFASLKTIVPLSSMHPAMVLTARVGLT